MTKTLLSRFESLKHLRDGPAVWQWAQESADEIERLQALLAEAQESINWWMTAKDRAERPAVDPSDMCK